MKDQRQRMILRLIKENEIETQEELTNELARHGLSAAQATVSRDIRELKLVKTMGTNGRSCYAEPGEQEENNYIRVLKASFSSVRVSNNILVIHTASGMAMACAAALDKLGFEEILGSIAGDDTVFAVLRDPSDKDAILRKLKKNI